MRAVSRNANATLLLDDKLETVQIVAIPGHRIETFSLHHGDGIQQREVKMNERRSRLHRVCSLPVFGISIFMLAMLGIAVFFPIFPPAIAGDAPRQVVQLPDWQRYVAWHESWHYLVLEDESWNCLIAGSSAIIQR
jgi:hypothetical protein